MKKKIIIIGIICSLLSLAFIIPATQNIYQSLRIFGEVIKLIEQNYVQEVDTKKLIQSAIDGMLSTLDPYSSYLDAERYKELRIHTTGKYGGLGFQVGKVGDAITVIAPFEGTPAYRAGLHPGDRIIKIDNESTKNMSIEVAVSKMRGTPGTKVTLTIEREGFREPLVFDLVREEITVRNIQYYGIIPTNIGYIRLINFSYGAGEEMSKALDSLIKKGANKFILDLRTNPGGLLEEAVRVAENFVEKGKIIVSTKGRNKSIEREYYSEKGSKINNLPIVVLVDRASASASEIVAGAIQDWDIGIIMGDTTFGKGSVQTVIPLQQEAVRFTTARYYTPSGRCIDKTDTAQFLIRNPTIGDTFISLGWLKRKLISGGAISPDVIIEKEKIPNLVVELQAKGIIFQYAPKYLAENPNIDESFEVTDQIMDNFAYFAKDKEIKFSNAQYDSSKKFIKTLIKRYIFQNKWGWTGEYKVILEEDNWIKKAVAILSEANSQKELFAKIK